MQVGVKAQFQGSQGQLMFFFGNKGDAIQPAQVKAIRDANAGRLQFYTTEELLKEHPMK